MKKDILGRKIKSKIKIPPSNLDASCRIAENIVRHIQKNMIFDPLQGIEKISIFQNNHNYRPKKVIADMNSLKTGDFNCRQVLSYEILKSAATYEKGCIEFEVGSFYPLDIRAFIHELGHNVHDLLPDKKRESITEMYSTLKAGLIEKILNGWEPSGLASSILAEYAFLHEFKFKKGDIICFQGYVGELSRFVKKAHIAQDPKKAYVMHENDSEFFAEMFMMYFLKRKDLENKRLLYFAENLIRKV